MRIRPNFILMAVLLFTNITPVLCHPEDQTITVCPLERTSTGRIANYRFSYRYLIVTNKDGSVEKIAKLTGRRPKMIVEEKLMDCIKTWMLEPSSRYTVSVSVGTTRGPDYISIASSKGASLKLVLSESQAQLLPDQRPSPK